MDHLIIVKHENDLIKHLMEPREKETRGTLGRSRWDAVIFECHDAPVMCINTEILHGTSLCQPLQSENCAPK